eukprot:3485528-Rhodomonas_salina.1
MRRGREGGSEGERESGREGEKERGRDGDRARGGSRKDTEGACKRGGVAEGGFGKGGTCVRYCKEQTATRRESTRYERSNLGC